MVRFSQSYSKSCQNAASDPSSYSGSALGGCAFRFIASVNASFNSTGNSNNLQDANTI